MESSLVFAYLPKTKVVVKVVLVLLDKSLGYDLNKWMKKQHQIVENSQSLTDKLGDDIFNQFLSVHM